MGKKMKMGVIMDNIPLTPPAAQPANADQTGDQPKPKQYILMVNDLSMLMLSKMFHGIQFLEVEGMNIKDDPTHMLMVTPVVNPVVQPITQNAQETQLEPRQEG